MSFWHTLPQPIFGLAPMDGVTDAAFRCMVARHGKPDVQYTEFVNVDELCRGISASWGQVRYVEAERPVLAQIYGANPETFYQATQIICALGFDGVDINMGCPAKSIAARGCGAGLIKNPPQARAIIRAVQDGVRDWAAGQALMPDGLHPHARRRLEQALQEAPSGAQCPRSAIPVSVKTRLGYDTVVIEDWLTCLLDEHPEVITVHGRTLKQMYRDQADWQAIGRAATLGRETTTLILGNGDIQTMPEAVERVRATQVHGVLIGRSAMGNPWLFLAKEWARSQCALATEAGPPPAVSAYERFCVALEHVRYFEALNDGRPFVTLRKYLGWYCRGFPGATEARAALFKTTNAAEVAEVFATYGPEQIPQSN